MFFLPLPLNNQPLRVLKSHTQKKKKKKEGFVSRNDANKIEKNKSYIQRIETEEILFSLKWYYFFLIVKLVYRMPVGMVL